MSKKWDLLGIPMVKTGAKRNVGGTKGENDFSINLQECYE